MADKKAGERGNQAWKKGIVIAVLAAVLAVFAGQEFLTSVASPVDDAGPLIGSGPSRPAAESQAKRASVTIPLDKVLAHNPFQLPLAIQEQLDALARQENEVKEESKSPEVDAEQSERIKALELLKQTGVQMFVESDKGRAAVIGGRVVREGDKIDGFVVVRIAKDGIELAVDKKEK